MSPAASGPSTIARNRGTFTDRVVASIDARDSMTAPLRAEPLSDRAVVGDDTLDRREYGVVALGIRPSEDSAGVGVQPHRSVSVQCSQGGPRARGSDESPSIRAEDASEGADDPKSQGAVVELHLAANRPLIRYRLRDERLADLAGPVAGYELETRGGRCGALVDLLKDV